MKIDIVGSECTWTSQLSTSFIINDEIIFDTPQGSFKAISHNYDLSKIKYIIISHFHSDHFADIHTVLEYIFYHHPDNHLTIIAPKGCCERLFAMFRLFEISYLEEPVKDRVTFISCENNQKIKLGSYTLKVYKMLHVNLDAYGFVIDDGKTKVGFSGDSAMCNNVHKILKKSTACFIDSANVTPNNKHLSVSEVLTLQEEYPDCKLYPIHLSDNSISMLSQLQISYPKQGESVTIE